MAVLRGVSDGHVPQGIPDGHVTYEDSSAMAVMQDASDGRAYAVDAPVSGAPVSLHQEVCVPPTWVGQLPSRPRCPRDFSLLT